MRTWLGLLALTLLATHAPATQEDEREFVRVEFEITALSGDGLYLDQGREALLQPGDRVRVFPPTGPARSGRILSVARTSARASLEGGMEGIEIGLRGAVWIPRARLEESAAARATGAAEPTSATDEPAPTPRVPEHPPWSAPPEEWTRAQPLLAPAHGQAPEERPRRLRAELFTALDLTRDGAGDEPRDLAANTLGFSGRLENPFRHGGELRFDAELFARSSELGGESEQETRFRLERASYAFGGVRGARDRGEVGRFLQSEFPELGFLDGGEYVHRTDGGHRLGASFGFQPLPDDTFTSGDDLAAALFYRYVSDEAQSLSLGGGYQKTWHDGVADRDLLVGELELHPGERTALFASTLVDLYTSGDELKSSGPEVTQLFLNATHRSEGGHGAGLFLSRLRFPELERDEFDAVTAAEIADDVNDRYGADGWLALGEHTQVYGRADAWSDQDDSGSGLRARLTQRELFARGETLTLELFASEGKFSDTLGLRTSARWRLEHGALDLAWDATNFTQDAVDEDLLQHALRGQYDLALGAWYLALYVESRFGDDQDALSLGFLLQRSFDGVVR